MATTLVIGNKNYSSWSLRPWLLLRHHGVAFEEVRLLLDTPAFPSQVARWSPSRRVPALHDAGLVVWDSLAICEYANERWLDGKGWPADIALRAVARSAAAEMHSGFGALRSQLPMNVRRQPRLPHWDAAADADIARVQEIWHDLRRRFMPLLIFRCRLSVCSAVQCGRATAGRSCAATTSASWTRCMRRYACASGATACRWTPPPRPTCGRFSRCRR